MSTRRADSPRKRASKSTNKTTKADSAGTKAHANPGRRLFLGASAATVAIGAGTAAGLTGVGPRVVSPPDLTGLTHDRARDGSRRRPRRDSAPPSALQTHVPVFGRIFPDLPPFAEPSEALTAAMVDMGRRGGIMDAADDLDAGPVALIADPDLSLGNPDNETHTAGVTFLGQFLDHDVTFDASSSLGVRTEPDRTTNVRSAFLDLDSLYGAGPAGSPQLYEPAERAKLRIEHGGLFEDVPRDANQQAIIGDPRNDEHLIVSGLHAAFILFHNAVVDRLRADGTADTDLFREARRLVTWHYQWIVVHQFLPLIIGQDLTDNILQERRFYRPDQAIIPVEFQGAAYRFGHSMVRPSYRANLAGDPDGDPDTGAPAFFGFIFDAAGDGQDDPVDLRGFSRAPRRFVGWQTFFDFEDGEVRNNKRIDTKISTPLFNLPLPAIPSVDPPTSLAVRNLLRHLTWSLPSGQAIAREMAVDLVGPTDLEELTPYGIGLEASTPLWYYILKEAELMADGLTLGPVGGRIVGEVLAGVLQLDPDSYLNQDGWAPTLPSHLGEGQFDVRDLLTFAGVDPASRGQ